MLLDETPLNHASIAEREQLPLHKVPLIKADLPHLQDISASLRGIKGVRNHFDGRRDLLPS